MRRASCVPLALIAGLLAVAAPAGADVYDDNPAAASRGPGDVYVLARGADGAIYERHLAGGAWSDWASLGGNAMSGPAVAAYGGRIHAFVTGADAAIYENVLADGGWAGWTSLGGGASSAPAAYPRRGAGLLDLAVRGTDNGAHFRSYVPGSGWSAWAALGGNLTSGPALDSQDPDVVNVWTRAPDGQLAQKAWTGLAWSDWTPLGGGIVGAPSVVDRQQNMLDVFVRGGRNAVYQKHWQGGLGWGEFALLDPTPIESSPAAVSDTPGRVILFARSGGGLAHKEWTDAGGWGAWTAWGPVASPPPPPPPPPTPDGLAELTTGLGCTPPGGRLRVSLTIRKRRGRPKPRVRNVVFFVKGGVARRADRRAPYTRVLLLDLPAGATGRVFARVFYMRKGSEKVRRKTVSKRFTICG